MNKQQELVSVNRQIKETKEQIQIFEVKLVDLEKRKKQLENEIYITEWAMEDPVYVMYANEKEEPNEIIEEMQMVQEYFQILVLILKKN